jgi:hypothetical protein
LDSTALSGRRSAGRLGTQVKGQIFLIPSSIKAAEIDRAGCEGSRDKR